MNREPVLPSSSANEVCPQSSRREAAERRNPIDSFRHYRFFYPPGRTHVSCSSESPGVFFDAAQRCLSVSLIHQPWQLHAVLPHLCSPPGSSEEFLSGQEASGPLALQTDDGTFANHPLFHRLLSSSGGIGCHLIEGWWFAEGQIDFGALSIGCPRPRRPMDRSHSSRSARTPIPPD